LETDEIAFREKVHQSNVLKTHSAECLTLMDEGSNQTEFSIEYFCVSELHYSKTEHFQRPKPSEISTKPSKISYFRRPKAYLRWHPSLGHKRLEIALILTVAVGHKLCSTATFDSRR
jgi:hypothetical protein